MLAMKTSPGIKFSQLRALVAVAECGNFGEAAWQLGVTQPTVSHAIATLEEELGVILLSRGRQGAHLTPAGEKIIVPVREMLRLLNVVTQEANLHKGLQGGKVRIATFRSAAAYLLPKIMARFHYRFPAVEVTLSEHYDYTNVEHHLREGKADIGFTFLPTSEELETIEVLRDEYIVLLPPHANGIDQLSWKQLTSMPLILYADDNSCFIDIQNYFFKAGYSLKPRYQFRETSTILNMVAQGLGAAIIPQLSAPSISPEIRVSQLPTRLERIVGAAIVADALHTPAVFAFLDVLKEMSPLDDSLELFNPGTQLNLPSPGATGLA